MKNNFEACFQRVLKDEGGYSDDPDDSGGRTNLGITQKETTKDVRTLTIADARAIYRNKYWNACDCDSLSSGVDYTVFDYGVNSGVGRPRKALQQFKSLKGTDLINAINNERTGFLQALAARRTKDQKYLKGWLSRVNRVRLCSLDLAQKDNKTGPAVVTGGAAIALFLSKYWHDHMYAILGIGGALALITGIAIHIYRNRGK